MFQLMKITITCLDNIFLSSLVRIHKRTGPKTLAKKISREKIFSKLSNFLIFLRLSQSN